MLTFDAATSRLLDRAYLGADFSARRRLSFDALAPGPGERIVDLGCGPGFMTLDLARSVGPSGRVEAVDVSADMLAAARTRCGKTEGVDFHEAAVQSLPFQDASCDGVVSLQVFEYVADLDAAVAEVARVLKPGGRAVIGDMVFGSLHWASDDPGRMASMATSWAHHVAHTDAPVLLPEAMRRAGLLVEPPRALPLIDTVLKPDGIARMMLILMGRYAIENGHADAATVASWQEEQERRAEEGMFFFSLTHVVTSGRRL